MPKRKSKRRRRRTPKPYRYKRKSKKIPILQTATAVAPAVIAFKNSGGVKGIMSNPSKALYNIVYEYSGLSVDRGTFDSAPLLRNITMWFGAYAGHKVAEVLGVNRALGKIPVIGKYLSV